MSFIQKLQAAWQQNQSLVCVGLDPDLARFPAHFAQQPDAIFQFSKAIIDATNDLVCAYKPQIAYFSAIGAEAQLEKITDYLKAHYPQIPIILDAKRGDIGSTASMYAREAFGRYHADAVTVNPYLGYDSIEPFLDYADHGVIILCRTSNPGAGDIQDLIVDGSPLYEHIARRAAEQWNHNSNCLLVVGATWPHQMAKIRSLVGNMPFLVPGIGAQGGDITTMVQAGQTSDGNGLIISSSRAILYASNQADFASAARAETLKLKDAINSVRSKNL